MLLLVMCVVSKSRGDLGFLNSHRKPGFFCLFGVMVIIGLEIWLMGLAVQLEKSGVNMIF